MDLGLIVLSFMAIALMRVAQKVSVKKVSREVQGRKPERNQHDSDQCNAHY